MIEAIGVYMIIAGIAYGLGWLTSGAMVRFANYLANRRVALDRSGEKGIEGRMISHKFRHASIAQIIHDLWIDPDPIPFDPTPPTAGEGYSKNHGKRCNIHELCGPVHNVYQVRPELPKYSDKAAPEFAGKLPKFHVCDICPNCGTLFSIL